MGNYCTSLGVFFGGRMMCHKNTILAAIILGAAGPGLAAPTETTLYVFPGPSNPSKSNGAPYDSLVFGPGGVLYGTTSGLDSKNPKFYGGVFSLTPQAGKQEWSEQVLYTFKGGDSRYPVGAVTLGAGGVLFGATMGGDGGASVDTGTIFELTPPVSGGTWSADIIYDFGKAPTGQSPNAPLILDAAGALYGTTAYTSFQGGGGVAYKLRPPSAGKKNWSFTSLYSFQGGADGETPIGALTKGPGGVLYGATTYGGGGTLCNNSAGCGTIFQLTPPAAGKRAWTETVLYAFTGGDDGAFPNGGLVADAHGNLYGTTYCCGGGAAGGVFELSPPSTGQTRWSETVIYAFSAGSGGELPRSGVIFGPGGSLYGTTQFGGASFIGDIYQLTPPASGGTQWSFTELYAFPFDGKEGGYPYGGVISNLTGDLFGTTIEGGYYAKRLRYGVVYKLSQLPR